MRKNIRTGTRKCRQIPWISARGPIARPGTKEGGKLFALETISNAMARIHKTSKAKQQKIS